MKYPLFTIGTLVLFLFYSCTVSQETLEIQYQTPKLETVSNSSLDASGVGGYISAKYTDQGCDFLFVHEDDSKIEKIVRPINLQDELKKDGLKVFI